METYRLGLRRNDYRRKNQEYRELCQKKKKEENNR